MWWLCVMCAAAAAAMADEYRVPLMPRAPVIDGRLDAGEWDAACGFDGLWMDGKLEERSARAWVGATETDIYVALESELPEQGKLLTAIDRDVVKIVFDDAMEVFIDPAPGAQRGVEYQFLASAANRRFYQAEGRGGQAAPPGWDGRYEIRHGFTPTRWVTEVRIPVASVAPGRRASDGAWGISVCRDWKQPWKFSSTAPRFRSGGTSFTFVKDGGLAVQHRYLADPFTRLVHLQVNMHNPGGAPCEVRSLVELKRNTMPELRDEKTLVVAPGSTAVHEFRHLETVSTAFDLLVRVTSDDGKVVYYDRRVAWGKPRERRWDTVPVVVRPMDFRFGHYPYLRKLRVLADTSGLPSDATLESLTFTLRRKGDAHAIGRWTLPEPARGRREAVFDVPQLDGQYELAMEAAGRNVSAEPVVREFERKRFEWENKGLGTGTRVYPPFEPIVLDGRMLRTVLREHTLNDAGLVNQITAGQPGARRPILAGPAAFKAVVDGADALVEGGPLKFAEVAGHRVEASVPLKFGAVGAHALAVWEYDGALKYDLTLNASPGRSLDALTLEIPLRADQATMIHAMGDGIRNTISDYLPAGQGVIWDARRVQCSDLPANFCSYIYLGNPHRGLCWFAENDKGWSWDRKTANLEVIRQGDAVVLRVHLVNKPVVLDAPRRLSFGIMAAPVKPRLEGWRHRWWTDRYTLLGTCINWNGGPGDCGNLYPLGKDMYFWHMIARANTEKIPRQEIEQCAQKGAEYLRSLDYVPYGAESMEAALESWKRHVYHNVGGSRYGATMVFYYNRATYNACEEYPTFMDEWVTDDYNPRPFKRHSGEIKIVPSASYIDHALYWYAESFRHGRNRGVYWDNWYFCPTYNRMMSDAYLDASGNAIPATGVWAMRELAKRTFVMMNDMNMLPITMPHMTSTNPLPAHSFATVQYDWEWKYSQGDVQDRHSRPYILLCSNGELAGVWPVMLGDHGPQAGDERIQRTFAGVCLVHELISSGSGRCWKTLRDPLLPLMQNPRLKVYRYWDETPSPVRTGRDDLPAIVYCVPGECAIVLVCSYAQRDVEAALTIDAGAMGFGGGMAVANLETGAPLPADGNAVRLMIPRHETVGLRITPR